MDAKTFTSGNKKQPDISDFLLYDASTDLFLDDVAVHTIKLTKHRGFAHRFSDESEAQMVAKSVTALFGKFDWHVVPVEC